MHGTEEAAGRILCDPDALTPILRSFSSAQNWRDHNMQIVLHVQVVGNAPTAPKFIASYVW